MWRGNLDSVGGCRNRHHLDASTEDETADDQLCQVIRSCGDDSAEDDDPGTTEHANLAAVSV